MSFGSNLKRLRRAKSFTQGELSDASDVKFGHISKLECDSLDPKISTVYKLMNGLNCNADDLLMDSSKTNMSTILKTQCERGALLPEENQRVLIEMIDKYCMAIEFQALLKDGNKSSFLWMKGKTADVLPNVFNE